MTLVVGTERYGVRGYLHCLRTHCSGLECGGRSAVRMDRRCAMRQCRGCQGGAREETEAGKEEITEEEKGRPSILRRRLRMGKETERGGCATAIHSYFLSGGWTVVVVSETGIRRVDRQAVRGTGPLEGQLNVLHGTSLLVGRQFKRNNPTECLTNAV